MKDIRPLIQEFRDYQDRLLNGEVDLYDNLFKLANLKRKKADLEIEKKKKEVDVSYKVAFNPDLKNERQREAEMYKELYQDPEYLKIATSLPSVDEEIKLLEGKIEVIRKALSRYKRILDFVNNQIKFLAEGE